MFPLLNASTNHWIVGLGLIFNVYHFPPRLEISARSRDPTSDAGPSASLPSLRSTGTSLVSGASQPLTGLQSFAEKTEALNQNVRSPFGANAIAVRSENCGDLVSIISDGDVGSQQNLGTVRVGKVGQVGEERRKLYENVSIGSDTTVDRKVRILLSSLHINQTLCW